MGRKKVILFVAFPAFACLAARLLGACPAITPVSISFVGYTNEPPGHVPGDEPEAIFRLTNHTASHLDYSVDIDAFKPEGRDSRCFMNGSGSLEPHGAHLVPVVTPGGTNNWRFLVVSSVSGPRPRWQYWVRTSFKGIGLRPGLFAGDRKYQPLTNTLTVP